VSAPDPRQLDLLPARGAAGEQLSLDDLLDEGDDMTWHEWVVGLPVDTRDEPDEAEAPVREFRSANHALDKAA
jgi:hypothetical protein